MKNSALNRLTEVSKAAARSAVQLTLGRDLTASMIRLFLTGTVFTLFWLVLIVAFDFPGQIPFLLLQSLPPFLFPILNIISTFLNPQVLLYLIPVLFSLSIGIILSSRYLADLFELESLWIAIRYLLASFFGWNYPRLKIDRGDVNQLNPTNPINRVGGPGFIQTHLGYAATSEAIDGTPKVYGLAVDETDPTEPEVDPSPLAQERSTYFIHGFERLREVVDLRDRLVKVDEIRAVTRDGVLAYARDAQMLFRVYSADKERSLKSPYPFTEESVRRLVYGQPVVEGKTRSPDQALAYVLRHEMIDFIAHHTLEEFLALQPFRSTVKQHTEQGPAINGLQHIHIPRRDLTEHFHTEVLRERLRKQGLELVWVGVGTWEIPVTNQEEAGGQFGPGHTLITTWRDHQRVQLYRSPEYLERQRSLRYREVTSELLQSWIQTWRYGDLPDQHRSFELLAKILKQLQRMEKRLEIDANSESEPELQHALEYIKGVLEPKVLGDDA
ncbi:MAG: hypothetical protein KAR65_03700 [Anaerolineales bacterium]|nr:hypothetical protein [Anaerolineales bacterium]